MKPQTFQHPEIRDENDNIIQPGAFGKNTPFCTKGNDGIFDYIANDLEYLYENRGSGGSGAGPRGPKGDPGPKGDLGPKGADGKNGQDGAAATIKVGNVTTGTSASVTNSGNSTNAVFDFVIPVSGGGQGIQGPKGDPGPRGEPGPKGTDGKDGVAATIKIGTVTTVAPGTNAKVTNTGTANAAVFNFSIPKGEKGEKGNTGTQGPPGPAADLSQYVKRTEIFDGNMIKLPNGAKIGVE